MARIGQVQELAIGPRGHCFTSHSADGTYVDVDVIHTCPVCGAGPLIGEFDARQSRIWAELNRFVCGECWPRLRALGYV